MRRFLFVSGALAVLALALASQSLSSPRTASAAAPLTGSSEGVSANASFFSDVDGVQTSTFVDAFHETHSDPGGTHEHSSVFVQIFEFDPGNPRNPRDDTFRNFFGSAELAPGQLQVSEALDSATLNAGVLVCELPGGPSSPPTLNCFNVTIDLAWAGSGEVHNQSGKAIVRIDGCKIHDTFSSSFRDATATGTVSDGSTDFVLGPSDFGGVSTFSSKQTFTGDCSFLFPPPPEP